MARTRLSCCRHRGTAIRNSSSVYTTRHRSEAARYWPTGSLVGHSTAVGWYADSNNLTHVLTRTPFQVALFKQGAWGDPTYTSPTGPALRTQTKFQALRHPADHSLLLLTRLAVHSQARMSASVTGPHRTPVVILGQGSRFGARLKTGGFHVVQAYRRKPGAMQVRLR